MQNRVDPFGRIGATPERGGLMGNRGCLHDAEKRIVRTRTSYKAWVTCTLSFAGRKRELMAPGQYTELFFIDEATAFAAGHRPCAACRRDRYNAFVAAWHRAKGLDTSLRPRAAEIDKELDEARRIALSQRHPVTGEVPDGAIVTRGCTGTAWLKYRQEYRPWSFAGYGPAESRPQGPLIYLTPSGIVAVLEAGYEWQPHPSLF